MPRPERVLLLNKVDKLQDNRSLLVWQHKVPGSIAISSLKSGAVGQEELTNIVREAAQGGVQEVTLRLPTKDSKAVNLVENRAAVLERHYADGKVLLKVRIGRRQLDQLRSITGRSPQRVYNIYHLQLKARQLPGQRVRSQQAPCRPVTQAFRLRS